MSFNNAGAPAPVTTGMQSTKSKRQTKGQAAKSKRSVYNMNPAALQKKRENDRNAQRNIREKARKNLAMLQLKIETLEKSQNPDLERQLAESEERNKILINLLLQHGIEPPEEAFPTSEEDLMDEAFTCEDMMGEMEIDRCATSYQRQSFSPANQVMYRMSPPQHIVQSQSLGLGSIQFNVGSPQHIESHTQSPQLTESPQSLDPCQHSPNHTDFHRLNETPRFGGQSQSMGRIQLMGSVPQLGNTGRPVVYSQSIPVQHTSFYPSMGYAHPIMQSQSMRPMESSHQVKFSNTGFHSTYTSNLDGGWGVPMSNAQAHMWPSAAPFRPSNEMSSYPSDFENMKMER